MLLSANIPKFLEKTKESKITWVNDYSKDSYRGVFHNSPYFLLIEMVPLVSPDHPPENAYFLKLAKEGQGGGIGSINAVERVTIQALSGLLKEIRQYLLSSDIAHHMEMLNSDLDKL